MKLDRNVHADKRGKYALLKLRELDQFIDPSDPFAEVAKPITDAINTLYQAGLLDYGQLATESEFFVIRLKDKYAAEALEAYAAANQAVRNLLHFPAGSTDVVGEVAVKAYLAALPPDTRIAELERLCAHSADALRSAEQSLNNRNTEIADLEEQLDIARGNTKTVEHTERQWRIVNDELYALQSQVAAMRAELLQCSIDLCEAEKLLRQNYPAVASLYAMAYQRVAASLGPDPKGEKETPK